MDVDTLRLCTTYAAQGRSVLVLVPNRTEALATMIRFDNYLPGHVSRLRGSQRVSWGNGGTIRIVAVDEPAATRGYAPDMVVGASLLPPLERAALLAVAAVAVH